MATSNALGNVNTADMTISGMTVGKGAGASSTNTVMGASALAASNTNTDVVAIGNSALNASTGSATDITAIGYQALLLATTPGANTTAIGSKVMSGSASYAGTDNTGVGFNALHANTSATQNTAIGSNALKSATSSGGCVAVGYNALSTGSTGIGFSVAIGASSLPSCTGQTNTAVGFGTLFSGSTASFNAVLGYQAGYTGASGGVAITTGAHNTFLGSQATGSNLATTGAIALGADAVASIASGATSGDNGPQVAIGSASFPVGFRGDGTIYSGGTGRGYWRPNLNGTPYLVPCFIDGTLSVDAVMVTDNNGSPTLLANSGTPGFVLTANSGAPPSWQAITAEGAIIQINGNTGSITPTTGVVTINGGTTGLTTSGSGSTLSLAGTLILANGGTNNNLTASNGGVLWSDASKLNILSGTATANHVLLSGSSATPAWSTATYPATTTVSQILYSSSANVIAGLSTANSAVLVTGSTGVPVMSSTMTNGQLIIGSTGATPTVANLTPSTGISITNGSGSITIAATGGGIAWTTLAGTSQAAAVNNGYISGNAGQTTVTLPATAAIGDVVAVEGLGAAGWVLAANTGQTIKIGTGTTSSAGSLTSAAASDNVYVTCIVANTTWRVRSTNSTGLTIA